jgi:hypothetical protein
VPVPKFECDDLDQARQAAAALLGGDAFEAAFDLGQHGQLDQIAAHKP